VLAQWQIRYGMQGGTMAEWDEKVEGEVSRGRIGVVMMSR
jgi:hypothetical protein